MSIVWATWIAYHALLIALTIGVIALVIRDHRREKAEFDAYLAAVREDAINEGAYDEAMTAGTPAFDQTVADHPWVAEQLLAHELEDDEAIQRWLR